MAHRTKQIQADFLGEFEWTRPAAKGPAAKPAWANLNGLRKLGWIVPQSAPGVERYRPLTDHADLYLTFAAIEPSESTIISFATRFGTLVAAGLQQNGLTPPEVETLDLWNTSVSALRAAVDLRHAIDQKNRRALSGWLVHGDGAMPRVIFRRVFEAPLCTVEFVAVDKLWLELVHGVTKSPLELAALALRQLTTTHLRAHVDLALLHTSTRSFHLTGQPRDLLGALWIQFARSLEGGSHLRTCRYRKCQRWFEVGGAGTFTRRAEFCSPTHKANEHNARKADALRLSREGLSLRAIATKVDKPLETIRGWLQPSSRRT